jgi:nitrous oxidase accessory protein NosD
MQYDEKSKIHLALAACCCLILAGGVVSRAYSQVIYVPRDFADLQQAIDASDKGATIRVAAGTYYGNFQLSGHRNLIGEDPQTTILTDDGEGPPDPIITIAGDCTFSGFTVTGCRGAGLGHAVMVTKGSPRIINNIIRDNSFTGLGIHSETHLTLALVSGNKIYGNGGAGIANYGQYSRSTIEHNEIYSNLNAGIVSIYFASPVIKENRLHHNSVGITVRDDARAVIIRNNITANNLVGINVTSSSAARIAHNSLISNGTVGINVDRQSVVEIFKNTIVDNGAEALYFKGKSEGVVDSNEASGNLPTIVHFDEARVRISNNSFYSQESPAQNAVVLTRSKALVGNNEIAGGIEIKKSHVIELDEQQLAYRWTPQPFWELAAGLPLDSLPPLESPVNPVAAKPRPNQGPRLKGCLGIF